MKSAITHLWFSLRDLATQSPILLVLIAVFSCTPLYIEQDWFSDIDLGLLHVVFLHRHTGNIYNARSKVLHHIYFIKYRHQRWSIYDSRNVPSHTRHRVGHRKHIIPMAILYDCAVLYVTW